MSHYRGAPQTLNDVIGGHVSLVLGSASLLAPLSTRRTVARAILGHRTEKSRSSNANVPTVNVSFACGFRCCLALRVVCRFAIAGRIVDGFVAELTAIVGEPEIRTKLTDSLLIDLRLDGPSGFRKFFFEQVAKWGQVIWENNLRHN